MRIKKQFYKKVPNPMLDVVLDQNGKKFVQEMVDVFSHVPKEVDCRNTCSETKICTNLRPDLTCAKHA